MNTDQLDTTDGQETLDHPVTDRNGAADATDRRGMADTTDRNGAADATDGRGLDP